MTHPDRVRTKKKSKKKSEQRPRGPATVTELRDRGDSVFHLSKRARVLLGTALGGALGAVVGQLFAEDPKRFGEVVTAGVSVVENGGKMNSSSPPTGGKAWFERRVPAMWAMDFKDGLVHAYEMAFDRGPGVSACAGSKLDKIEPATMFASGAAQRCDKCTEILAAHGYENKIPGMPQSEPAPSWKPGDPIVTPDPTPESRAGGSPNELVLGKVGGVMYAATWAAGRDGAHGSWAEHWAIGGSDQSSFTLAIIKTVRRGRYELVKSKANDRALKVSPEREEIGDRLVTMRNAWPATVTPPPTSH